MKTTCYKQTEAKIAERNEHSKKLYRYVSDVSRRIDDATSASNSINDLFSIKIEIQRQKLRDNCEKLLFLDPINYGKKSLELLWRKAYYETVAASKKLKESYTDEDTYLFSHILCGIGHFHHIITKIISEMNVLCKEVDYSPIYLEKETKITINNEYYSDEIVQIAKSILHSCLIYLGDLSRYQSELFLYDPSIAARYYLQAAHLNMSLGMPYNQMGNLYLDRNYNLDSACYYIHCLTCETPFDGALGNLSKIFEKNAQYFENSNNTDTITQSEHIQTTIGNFLSLLEIWYLGKDDADIPQRCNTIAQELKIAMDFNQQPLPDINKCYKEYTQAIEDENINPSYLNGNLIHKMTQICLFTISKVSEIDEQKAFACKAFTLAFLSQLLQKLLKQLESFGLKNPGSKYKPRSMLIHNYENKTELELDNNDTSSLLTPITNGDIKHENLANNIDAELKKSNGEPKTNGKKQVTMRRRRRGLSSESSDDSEEESDTNESTSDESSCSDNDISEMNIDDEEDNESKSEDGANSDIETLNENVDENVKTELIISTVDVNADDSDKQPKLNQEERDDDKLKTDDISLFLLGDNFLPSLRLLQNWILTEKELILSCGESGEPLFQCVVDLLNIFMFYFNPKSSDITIQDCEILNQAKSIAKNLRLEYKSIPLPEDMSLRGTSICKFDKDASEWKILEKFTPSICEENVIRILTFIDFGYQIAKIVPRIKFNRSMKLFYLKKMPVPKVNTKTNHKRNREWHNSKKTQMENGESGLLRRLGRLWLASQVRELEKSTTTGVQHSPALLALDASALHGHLKRVKQLMKTRNFILLIPAVVLQELDILKRDRISARDAIRWLELQLKSGSRFLRAQKPGQSKPLPLIKYPRKAPPHVNNFIQILEFCNHFIVEDKSSGGYGDTDPSLASKTSPLLILLLGNETGTEEEYKEFSVTGAAKSAGISVEYIENFYSKWRQKTHKSGKKR